MELVEKKLRKRYFFSHHTSAVLAHFCKRKGCPLLPTPPLLLKGVGITDTLSVLDGVGITDAIGITDRAYSTLTSSTGTSLMPPPTLTTPTNQ